MSVRLLYFAIGTFCGAAVAMAHGAPALPAVIFSGLGAAIGAFLS